MVTNQLVTSYSHLFQNYTEKGHEMSIFTIGCQRIKGLSLWKAVISAFIKSKPKGGEVIKTLINTFKYPKYGPGMMWESVADKIRRQGGNIIMGAKVIALNKNSAGVWQVTFNHEGEEFTATARDIISSIPVRSLMNNITPKPTSNIIEQANKLKYRDFFRVALIIEDKNRLMIIGYIFDLVQ